MLFSQDPVADFINRYFEPVWESVRPVPLVHIDFGNGTVLTRTLHGNILTSVCTSDGRVLDALPGIYEARTYVERLNQLRLLAQYLRTRKQTPDQAAAWVRAYHKRQAEALAKNETPEQFVERRRLAPLGKAVIESPVEILLARPTDVPEPFAIRPHLAIKEGGPALAKEDVSTWKVLADDTRLNETTRRRQIHEMLAKLGPVWPEKITRPVYKEVLHADLDDPYLGLGKVLFDTYPFAREERAR